MNEHISVMNDYISQIAMIPLVEKDEEKILANKIQQGDIRALEKLITSNLRLVVKIAHGYKGFGLPFGDLISEGNIGLMQAAKKFDPSKGANFGTYSSWWVKQAIRNALSLQKGTIRVPIAASRKMKRIRVAKTRLISQFGRSPTTSELSKQAKLSPTVINRLERSSRDTVSLHSPVIEGGQQDFHGIMPNPESRTPYDFLLKTDSFDRLRQVMKMLNDRDRSVLIMRFGLDEKQPRTLEEVSSIIGCSRERVRQIQIKSLEKLKELLDDQIASPTAQNLANSQ